MSIAWTDAPQQQADRTGACFGNIKFNSMPPYRMQETDPFGSAPHRHPSFNTCNARGSMGNRSLACRYSVALFGRYYLYAIHNRYHYFRIAHCHHIDASLEVCHEIDRVQALSRDSCPVFLSVYSKHDFSTGSSSA